MEGNNKFIKIDIRNPTCYCFHIIKIEDFDLDNILIDEKSQEGFSVYNISYKTLIAATPLHIRFYKIDRFIRVFEEARYLVLFGSEEYGFIYNRTRYLIRAKSDITYFFSKLCKDQSRFIRFVISRQNSDFS